jgi:hypothetical protein
LVAALLGSAAITPLAVWTMLILSLPGRFTSSNNPSPTNPISAAWPYRLKDTTRRWSAPPVRMSPIKTPQMAMTSTERRTLIPVSMARIRPIVAYTGVS